ncbi:hypothetical protein D3C86_1257640 [compost metagenome]
MKFNSIDHNVDLLKRQAKKLKKSPDGPSHSKALDLVAQKHGYQNWNNYIKAQPDKDKRKTQRRPEIPVPAALNYHHVLTGAIIGQHPNRKLSNKNHFKLGRLLKELLSEVEYYKKADKIIKAIRATMDTWLGCEYDKNAIDIVTFNNIYFGISTYHTDVIPSLKRQAQLRTLLRRARGILDCNYHDCKPLNVLYSRFDLAMKTLERWPKNIKIPGSKNNQIRQGTFVRVKTSKVVGVVLHHDVRRSIIEGYSDAGRFEAGRHEVSVMRSQPDISSFRPMRLYLPYGKWKLNDGTEILFNRDYNPIWAKSITGVVKAIEPDTDINSNVVESYFNDKTAPYYNYNKKSFTFCLSILKDWGVENKNPIILDKMFKAITDKNMSKINTKQS